MSLSRKERDLDKIFEALDNETTSERKRAVTRIHELFDEFSDEEAEKIRIKLKEANKAEKRKSRPLQLKMESVLLMYDTFHSKEDRIAETQRIIEEAELKKKNEADIEKLSKEKEEADRKARILREKIEMEEDEILSNYSFVTKEASNRLPMFDLVRTFFRGLGIIYLVIGVLVLIAFPNTLGVIGMGIALMAAVQLLFSAEIITFLSDFHDSNFINTKVRIETLKVLEKINENLKKK